MLFVSMLYILAVMIFWKILLTAVAARHADSPVAQALAHAV